LTQVSSILGFTKENKQEAQMSQRMHVTRYYLETFLCIQLRVDAISDLL